MTLTGPQIYPLANRVAWYEDNYGGTLMESDVIAWHTTEGMNLPGYGGGGSAPNFTAVPDFSAKRLIWYQHFRFDVSSRALQNDAGGVQTNTLNVTQVELVGTCDSRHATTWVLGGKTYRVNVDYLYSGALPDWVIRDLAAFALWASKNHNVPLSSGLFFKSYPASYGESNGVRMSNTKWLGFKGHCGHQHVPENDHGDPGSFPIQKILDVAKGGAIDVGDDMPLTTDDVKKIWTSDGLVPNGNLPEKEVNPFIPAATSLSRIETVARRTEDKVDALASIELTDAQVDVIAGRVAEHPALAEAIAEKVAVKVAARMQA